jgi:hypothetical protein
VDGSGGLVCGIGFLPALAVAVSVAVRRRRPLPAALAAGLLGAGLQTVYPEIVPLTVGSLGLFLLGAALVAWRRRALDRLALRRAATAIAAGAGVAILASPRASIYTGMYLTSQSTITAFADKLVGYNMRFRYLPGWLLQNRDFYDFAFANPTSTKVRVVEPLLALGALALAAAAWVRLPRTRILAPFVLVAIVQAIVGWRSLDCSYCVQRTLLTLAVTVPTLLAGGLAVLWASPRMLARGVAIAGAVVLLGSVGVTLARTEQRFGEGSYAADRRLGDLARATDRLDGPVDLEGLDAEPLWSWADLPTAYAALSGGRAPRLSIPADTNDYGGFSYLRTWPYPQYWVYDPGYRWVATRLVGARTGRRTVLRAGPYALQERQRPFDATLVRGGAIDTYARDPNARVWAQPPGNVAGGEQGPLTFWVSALSRRPAYLRVALRGPRGLRLRAPGPVVQRQGRDGVLRACLPVPGAEPRRVVSAEVVPAPPGPGPGGGYEQAPRIARTTQIVGYAATAAPCR